MKRTRSTALLIATLLLGGTLIAGCAGTGVTASGDAQGMQAAPLSPDVAALRGMRAASLDGEMNRLGFRNVGGYQAEGAAHSTWWNPRGEQCVKIVTREAKVADIESIYAGNCQ